MILPNLSLPTTRTTLMGILNATPDSFSDGGQYNELEKAVNRIEEMLSEGADIIDIGGESSRPFSEPVSLEEELSRTIPIIKAARQKLGDDFLISIDTYKSETAKQALDAGANIVNDISAFTLDKEMVKVVSNYQCPVVLMHLPDKPKDMQKGDIHYDNVTEAIKKHLLERIDFAISKGISRSNIIIDPGIGFGKTVEHNLQITREIGDFKELGCKLLYGISRKSTTGKVLQDYLNLKELPNTDERLEPSLAAAGVAVMNGADIIRTHDVKETKKFLSMIDALKFG